MRAEVIRVVLSDDHHIVRTGLRTVLGSADDVIVVGEAASGREAIALAVSLQPDVILMDLSMSDIDGLEATRRITAMTPHPRILVLTMHEEEEYLTKALEAGAAGYLVKIAAHYNLLEAIRSVASGDMYVRSTATSALARRVRNTDHLTSDRLRFEKLSDRERAVLRLVAQGYSAPDIGERLAISPKTVDTYKQRINVKIRLSARPDYVRFALRLGLLTVDPELVTS